MKFGAPRQQGVFWDVATTARNRKSAALPASLQITTTTRGVTRMPTAKTVHRDRSALRSKRVVETLWAKSDAYQAEREAKLVFDQLTKAKLSAAK